MSAIVDQSFELLIVGIYVSCSCGSRASYASSSSYINY